VVDGSLVEPARRQRPAARAAWWATDLLLWPVLAAWTVFWAWLRWSPSGISWHFFPLSARLLFGDAGLRMYAQHPELQFGPLTAIVVAPFTLLPSAAGLAAAQATMTVAGLFALWLVTPLAGPVGRRRTLRILLAGLVLVPTWTVLSVRWAHPDDVLALVLLAGAIRAVAAGRGLIAGLLLGAAVAAKPWAVGAGPILLALNRRDLLRGLPAAALVTVGAWVPFVLADAGTLAALRPPVGINSSSPLRLFGVRAEVVPRWTRTAQLVAAPLAGLLAVLRRRWPAALLVAIAVRLALDPQDIAYYAGGAVLAAVITDLAVTGWLVPWTSLVTAAVLWQPFVVDFEHRMQVTHGLSLWWFQHPTEVALVHLGWTLAVLALLAVPDRLVRSIGTGSIGSGGALGSR
jgi:hypothetical protein